ncbi:unnamed protein product [Linum trigynum]|uniref:Uncharacterized protein n=1 Tax=Linum trigynum TaxID=586398 RepID=A0AAV2FAA8_9ROSI
MDISAALLLLSLVTAYLLWFTFISRSLRGPVSGRSSAASRASSKTASASTTGSPTTSAPAAAHTIPASARFRSSPRSRGS